MSRPTKKELLDSLTFDKIKSYTAGKVDDYSISISVYAVRKIVRKAFIESKKNYLVKPGKNGSLR